eukprot:351483-Chlamydomonas_euryale.AAC.2
MGGTACEWEGKPVHGRESLYTGGKACAREGKLGWHVPKAHPCERRGIVQQVGRERQHRHARRAVPGGSYGQPGLASGWTAVAGGWAAAPPHRVSASKLAAVAGL